MADPFFYFGLDDDEDYLMSLGLILPPPPPAPPGSAFEAYHQRRRAPALSLESPMAGRGHQHSSNSGAAGGVNVNVHRRMFGYLRRIDAAAAGAAEHPPAPGNGEAAATAPPQAPRGSRFRHIMRERLRRERLSQGFADLHALLPPGVSSKGGKNEIVGAAAVYIRELEGRKRWLSARNQELLMLDRAAATRWMGGGARNAGGGGDGMVVKVRAESGDHAAAADAFEAVLRRLKAMEEQLRVTAIRSCFLAGGMCVDVGVESHKQVSTREVDTAITNALMELGKQDPRSSKPSFSCQVESGVPMA